MHVRIGASNAYQNAWNSTGLGIDYVNVEEHLLGL